MKHVHVRSLARLSMVLVPVFAAATAGTFEAAGANMLANPGFAAPVTAADWTLSNGAVRNSYQFGGGVPGPHDRDGFVLIFSEGAVPANSWGGASQTLAGAAGQAWTFSAWVMVPSPAFLHNEDYGLLDITFQTASGGTTTVESAHIQPAAENVWTKVTVVATAPANTAQVSFGARFYHGDTSTGGKLYFDEFFAEGIPPIPEPNVAWTAVPVILLGIAVQKRVRRGRG